MSTLTKRLEAVAFDAEHQTSEGTIANSPSVTLAAVTAACVEVDDLTERMALEAIAGVLATRDGAEFTQYNLASQSLFLSRAQVFVDVIRPLLRFDGWRNA